MSPPPSLPVHLVPKGSPGSDDGAWRVLPSLAAFVLASGRGPAEHATVVRLAWDDAALSVRFECEDLDPWGTFEGRDEPLWREEVVEIFLAPGASNPTRYFEFEFSPTGAVFDAAISNPDSSRETLRADVGWDCPGLRWSTRLREGGWTVTASLPWSALVDGPVPGVLRANFFRIERPRPGAPEFSCWSPTMTDPADFHRPERFGVLRLAREG